MREESRMIIEERKRRERNDAGHAIHRRLAKDNWRLLVDSAEDRWLVEGKERDRTAGL